MRKLDITRVPIIKEAHFQHLVEDMEELNPGGYGSTAEGQMHIWFDGILRLLSGGNTVSVADLRSAAGLTIEPLDYFYGWDNLTTTSLNVVNGEIRFPLFLIDVLREPMDPYKFDLTLLHKVNRDVIENPDLHYYNEGLQLSIYSLDDNQRINFKHKNKG